MNKEEEPFPSEEEIERARGYLFRLLVERSAERRVAAPAGLAGGCKFGSLLALALFGGELRGNWLHQYVELAGRRIDLTGGEGVQENIEARAGMMRLGLSEREVGWVENPFQHDPRWWFNSDHVKDLESCLPRVRVWVERWRQEGFAVRGELPAEFRSLARAHRERERAAREERRKRAGGRDPKTRPRKR